MRNALFASLMLLVPMALGCSALVSNELDDKPSEQGDGGPDLCSTEFCPPGAADGSDCSTSAMPDHICVDFCCVPEGCGNGFAETGLGEECDDGNDVSGDGCENDCTFTCTEDADCDDGDPCNGEFSCDTDNTCFREPGNLPAPGTPCDLMTGDGGVIAGQCSADNTCEPIL